MRWLLAALLLLAPLGARADVTYAASGATTVTSGTGTCTPATTNLGTVGANDVVFLVVTSEAETISLTTANGFTQLPGSPQTAGTAATDPGITMAVYWRRGFTSAPVVADSGNHTDCALHRFTGVDPTGNPWAVIGSGNDSGANDTSGSIPSGGATGVANTLVVLFQGTSYNATSTTECSGWTNANLGSLTERFDSTNTSGLGGGHCMATGTYAGTGDYGATTVTLAHTSYKGAFSVALKPWVAGDTNITQDAVYGGTSGTAASITGVSITGAANRLATAYVHIGGNEDYRGTISFSANGGLTWTLRSQAAGTGNVLGDEVTQVWTAPVPTTITNQTITVVTSKSGGLYGLNLELAIFSGVDTGNIGDGSNGGTKTGSAGSASGAGSGTSGAATVSITPLATRSVLVAAGGEWNGSAARALAYDQTMLRESRDTTNVADHWAQRLTGGSTSTSATSLATTNAISGSSAFSMAALELKEASSGTTYDESFTEAVTAAESLGIVSTYASSFTEAATAGDSLTSAGTFPNAFSEAVTAGDSLTGGKLTSESFTEAVTAGESLSSAKTAAPASFTEAVTAGDSLTHTGTFPNAFTEAVTAGDSATGGKLTSDSFTEAVTAGDSLSTTGTFPNAFTEAATAGDSLTSAKTAAPASFTEAVTAGDSLTSTGTFPNAFTEAVSAGEGLTSTKTAAPASFTESVTAAESLTHVGAFPNAISEPVTLGADVVDQLEGAPTVYNESFTEAVAAGDSLGSTGTFPNAFSEALTLSADVSDNLISGCTPQSGMTGFWGGCN